MTNGNYTLFDLANKKVVVTGAANGNGKAMALGLAGMGAKVVLADIDLENLQEVREEIIQAGGTAEAFELDISSRDACNRFAEQVRECVGDIDVLVNNAGVLRRVTFDQDEAYDALELTLSINVHGTYNLSRAFLGSLKATRGNIVNVASIQSFVAAKTAHTYAVSKGAVAQLTKTLAAELAEYGIRVNAIAPGMIETAMSKVTRSDEQTYKSFLTHVPMARSADPVELVGPVAFLSSEAASYVTGVILPVDGGYLTI